MENVDGFLFLLMLNIIKMLKFTLKEYGKSTVFPAVAPKKVIYSNTFG